MLETGYSPFLALRAIREALRATATNWRKLRRLSTEARFSEVCAEDGMTPPTGWEQGMRVWTPGRDAPPWCLGDDLSDD